MRVIGSLIGRAVRRLFEAISCGEVVLDLSEVDEANDSAVMFIAHLPKERCTLAACPGWLLPWLKLYRQPAGVDSGPGGSGSGAERITDGRWKGP